MLGDMAGSAERSTEDREGDPELQGPNEFTGTSTGVDPDGSGAQTVWRGKASTNLYRNDTSLWVEAIETSYDLWARENDVKTTKLYTYILTQSILVTAYAFGVSSNGILVPALEIHIPVIGILVPLIGIGTSCMALASIGRTVSFQKAWKAKRQILVEQAPEPVKTIFDFYPTEEDKEEYWYGRLSSKYVLLAPPIVGFVMWCLVLIGGTLIFFMG